MKKIVSLLFHRVVFVAFFLLVQLTGFVGGIVSVNINMQHFHWLNLLISAGVVVWILSTKSDPAYKIAWIVPILVFPIFGGLFYLFFGGNRLSKRTKRRMHGLEEKMERILLSDRKAHILKDVGEDAVRQSTYLEEIAHCPVYTNTETTYYPLGELCFPDMLEELRKAEHYIFVEYFIIEAGEMWDSILEILKEKARKGVCVRLLYDDIGCIFTLPTGYAKDLEHSTGIQCQVFNPFVPVLNLRMNNRDHRKILAIDGKVAFTGGINLADEYINTKPKYGHWKDTAIRVKGEAAWSMAVMFLTVWDDVRGNPNESYSYFYPRWRQGECPRETTGYVQPYTDNPLDDEAVGQAVYLGMVNRAKEYVYIMTPYLIVDNTVNAALCIAAKSGIDVRIITPFIPDKPPVLELTRAHYLPLLEAGVKIYEYTPGFVHAKLFVVDDLYGTVGTVNLDYRSLFLHFENGVWLCGDPTVLDMRRDFEETQQRCHHVTLEEEKELPWWRRFFRVILRVFAPLL